MAPLIAVASGPIELANRAADGVCARLRAGIAERGEAHMALTGGSSPTRLYANLRREPWRSQVDWSHVALWMGDDRWVPSDDPNSNAGMARRLLFADESSEDPPLPVPPQAVRFFPIDDALIRPDGLNWAAAHYADEVRAAIRGTPPVFDVVLLGVGTDGHILSVFPGSPALAPEAPLALPIPAPTHIEPHLPRLTLNPAIVPAARAVILIAQGEGKAAVVNAVLNEPHDSATLPAKLAAGENAYWFLDAAAAAQIGGAVSGVDNLV